MKVWVLFTWMSSAMPYASISTFANEAECLQDARVYAKAVCVQVVVPRK